MSRVVLAVAVALGLLGAAAGEARAPARLMVSAQKHSLVLSRQTLVAGPALIQLLNRGQDPHDLKLRRSGGAHGVVSMPETRPGGLAEAAVRLRPGRYRLWCSLPGHRALGMHAKLRVRRVR